MANPGSPFAGIEGFEWDAGNTTKNVLGHDVSKTDPELADEYDRAAPYWHHYRGIERYWRKRREAARIISP